MNGNMSKDMSKTMKAKASRAKPASTSARSTRRTTPRAASTANTTSSAKKPPAQKLASARPIVVKPPRKASVRAAPKAPAKASSPAARGARAAPPRAATKAAPSKEVAKKRPASRARAFRPQDFIVYPGHGVGRVKEVETLEVGGLRAEVFVLTFPNMMLVRVPVTNASKVGMRGLADKKTLRAAMRTLRGRARIKRTMWSRRAQEYEAKINSGNLVAIAEVVRDLYRATSQPEQSYSERQLYEQARARMVQEVALLRRQTEDATTAYLEDVLSRAAGLATAVTPEVANAAKAAASVSAAPTRGRGGAIRSAAE